MADKKKEIIEKLIAQGESELQQMAEAQLAAERAEKVRRLNKWMDFMERARKMLPAEVERYLIVNWEDGEPFTEPPDNLGECNLFELKIDMLAPIRVMFHRDDQKSYTYRVGVPVSDADWKDGALVWSYSPREVRDGGRFDTRSLPIALAMAKERFNLMHDMINELEKNKAAKEAKKAVEPVYEDMDGSEPVPDLVLLNGIRALIREEVVKTISA